MSTAAPVKGPGAAPGYQLARPQGQCCACGAAIAPHQKFMAALKETPQGFCRADCCLNCWPLFDRAQVVAFWQTSMPRPEQKPRLFVDDGVLCDLFERLSAAQDPAKVNFRFVLGLILMRKRLVIYESTRTENGQELWSVRLKGREQLMDLVNPHLGEEQVRDVSQQLSDILQQELG